MSKQLVVKSNYAIEASYKLTLNEQRLILLCVEQVKKGRAVGVSDRFEITASNFADLFEISADRAYSELMEVADKLYERSVTVHQPDPDNPRIATTKTRWISGIDYIPGEGCIAIRFAAQMIPYISMLEGGFTRYNLQYIAKMKSVYGIRFYEFFKCWLFGSSRNTKKISLDELKSTLELGGKYPAIKDFKLHVLDKAMRDINKCSDLRAKYTTIKTGRKVTHFEFEFWVREQKKTEPTGSSAKKKTYTKSDLDKDSSLARPGESYEQALKRLNNNRN